MRFLSRWIVVGAGIAGLAAAWEIRRRGEDAEVCEIGHRPGGMLQTFSEGGFTVDAGAEAIRLTPRVRELLAELGLEKQLIHAAPAASRRFYCRNSKLVEMKGPPIPPPSGPEDYPSEDESLLDYFRRRVGEDSDAIADAIATGIYAGDPARLSARFALGPMLPPPGSRPGPPPPLATLPGGMATLVDALARGVGISTRREVSHVGFHDRFFVRSRKQGDLHADRVVVALGPAGLALSTPDPPIVLHAPVSVLGIGMPAGPTGFAQSESYGFLMPESERRFALGVLFTSSVFPHVAPPGRRLWRAFVGGTRHPERAALTKEEVLQGVREDVEKVLGIDLPGGWVTLLRHRSGIPQPGLSHREVIQARDDLERESPGLAFCGLGFEGVGVDQALESGIAAVGRAANAGK